LNLWSAAGSLMEIAPEVRDNLDPDASIRLIADSENVPKSVMIAIEDRDQMRQLRAEQQQAAEARKELAEVASAAGDVLPGAAAMQNAGSQGG